MLRSPIRALPSVIVDTEKVLREADGSVGRAALTAHFGWTGDRSGVHLESRSGEPVRSPKIISDSTCIDRPREEWDRVAKLMTIKFRESGHPVFRATSPLSRVTLKSKGGGKLSIHFCADGDTIETVFRTIISVNQLSIYRAVSDLCDEYSACRTRTVRPVLAGRSDLLFEPAKLLITTPTPSIELLHKKMNCKSTKNEWKGSHNKID